MKRGMNKKFAFLGRISRKNDFSARRIFLRLNRALSMLENYDFLHKLPGFKDVFIEFYHSNKFVSGSSIKVVAGAAVPPVST